MDIAISVHPLPPYCRDGSFFGRALILYSFFKLNAAPALARVEHEVIGLFNYGFTSTKK